MGRKVEGIGELPSKYFEVDGLEGYVRMFCTFKDCQLWVRVFAGHAATTKGPKGMKAMKATR